MVTGVVLAIEFLMIKSVNGIRREGFVVRAKMSSIRINICVYLVQFWNTYIYLLFSWPLYSIYGGISASFVTLLGSFNVDFDGVSQQSSCWFVTVRDIECSLYGFYFIIHAGSVWTMVSDGFVRTMAFIGSISCPPPPILWLSLRVMTTTRIWKVSCSDMNLRIPFHSHLMRSGGAIHVVAMWCASSGGCLCLVWGAFWFSCWFSIF